MSRSPTARGVRSERVPRITTAVLFAAWLVDYVDRLVITLALPAIGEQFHLDEAAQGAILSAFFVTYALSQIPGGVLADRWGSKPVMLAAATLWSGFTALTGAASSYAWLLVTRLGFGMCQGLFPGASLKAISERTERHGRLTASSIVVASNTLGAALAPLVGAPLIALVGWRQSFLSVAGLGFVMVAILWFALPPPVHAHELEPEAGPPPRVGPLGAGVRLLRSGTLWIFALVFFGFDLVGWGLVAWVPPYLVEQRHLALVDTGLLAAIPWFGASVATVLGGVLFDRLLHDRYRWLVVPCMLLTAGCLYLMLSAETIVGFVVWETTGVFLMSLANMPIFGLPLRLLPPGVAASGTALVNFGGQLGGAVAPVAMGALAQSVGFDAAFAFLVFGAGLTAVAALWSPQTQVDFEARLRPVLRGAA